MSKFLDLDGLDYFAKTYVKPSLTRYVNGFDKNLYNYGLSQFKVLNSTNYTWSDNIATHTGGIIFEINTDGTITATVPNNYSYSSACIFNLSESYATEFAGKTYAYSGCPTGGDYTNGYSMYIADSNSNTTAKDEGTGVISTFPSPSYRLRICFRNTTPSGTYIFKPMICTVDDWNVSHDYVPYKNGIATNDEILTMFESI